ncbi:MAG: DUF1587 domain-containing protein, partial [Myxococcaceae bacterium]|nr:DUF1587 domain-containing protein [Myxococcaceae bacterium]
MSGRFTLAAVSLVALAACMGDSTARLESPQEPADPSAPWWTPNQSVPLPPAATPTRLLTREEYDNTVRDLLGDDTRPA